MAARHGQGGGGRAGEDLPRAGQPRREPRRRRSRTRRSGRLVGGRAARTRLPEKRRSTTRSPTPTSAQLLAGRMEAIPGLRQGLRPVGRAEPAAAGGGAALLGALARRGHRAARVRLIGPQHGRCSCKDDEDKGQLRLGTEQLARAQRRGPRSPGGGGRHRSRHHPLRKGWLADEGIAPTRGSATTRTSHLSGHVHEAYESEEARSTARGGASCWVTAGAAHNEQLPLWIPASHGYNFGEPGWRGARRARCLAAGVSAARGPRRTGRLRARRPRRAPAATARATADVRRARSA